MKEILSYLRAIVNVILLQLLKIILEEFDGIQCGGVIIPATIFGFNNFVNRSPLPVTDHMILTDNSTDVISIKGITKMSEYAGSAINHILTTHHRYLYQDGSSYNGDYISSTIRIDNKIKYHHYTNRGLVSLLNRATKEKSWHRDNLWGVIEWESSMNMVNESASLYSPKLKRALNLPSHNATPENTVFLSVADYPDPERKTEALNITAKHFGVELLYASYGEKFNSAYQSKYLKILQELKIQQKQGKKYAFFY